MKKFISILTVLAALTSCSKIESVSPAENELTSEISEVVSTADDETAEGDYGYKVEDLFIPEGYDRIGELETFPDSDLIFFRGYRYNGITNRHEVNIFYASSLINSSTNYKIPYISEFPEEYEAADAAFSNYLISSDLSIYSFVTLEDHGGMRIPDYEFDHEDFDWTTYNDNCTSSFAIYHFNEDGRLLSNANIDLSEEYFDNDGYIKSSAFIAGDGFIMMSTFDGKVVKIYEDGSIEKVFQLEGDEFNMGNINFIRDRDGKIMLVIRDTMEDNSGNPVQAVSYCDIGEDFSVGEPFYIDMDQENAVDAVASSGRGEYRLFLPKTDGLYGITDSGETKRILDYEDTGIAAGPIVPAGKDAFVAIYSTNNGMTINLCKLIPREPGEKKDLTEITIATPYGRTPTEFINAFNKSQSDYKIKSVSYARTEEEQGSWSSENNALNMALISGDAPDIIFGLSYTTYLNYRNKGVFADMYPYMENDPIVNKNTILPNILKSAEASDGSLYALFPDFNVATIMAKTKVFGTENWTFDEMLDIYENTPVNAIHKYDECNKEEIFRRMLYCMDDLIDYENAECNFESEDFRKLLEFCDRFVNVVDSPDKMTEGSAAVDNYYYDKFRWLEQDAIITENVNLGFPLSYSLTKYLQGGGEDMTLVGYPSSDRSGGRISPGSLISITRDCECKEGAWAFISYLIQHYRDDDPYSEMGDGALPLLSEQFEDFMDHTMNANRTASGQEIPNYTQEDRDMIANYIKSCKTLGTMLDEDVSAVLDEETGLYFRGEQSMDAAIEHIQNRASIIISEKS